MDGLDFFVATVTDLEKRMGIEKEGRSWESYLNRRTKEVTTLIEIYEQEAERLERLETTSFD